MCSVEIVFGIGVVMDWMELDFGVEEKKRRREKRARRTRFIWDGSKGECDNVGKSDAMDGGERRTAY